MRRTKKATAIVLFVIATILGVMAWGTIAPSVSSGKEAENTLELVEQRISQATMSDVTLNTPDMTGKNGEVLGTISVEGCGVKTALKYGTGTEENLTDAACVADYSTPQKSFVLGHNYTSEWAKNKIFHGLVDAKKGQEVVIRLLKNKDGKDVVEKYVYKIIFSKQYKESEFYADNLALFTDNADCGGDYDLALATCNHYKDGTRGRQLVFCQLVSAS